MGEIQGILNSVFDEGNGALRISGPELVADDPSEVDLVTDADTTTIALTDDIARLAFPYRINQFYWNVYGASVASPALPNNTLCFFSMILRQGQINRMGINVTTGQAATVMRLGIYTDNDGFPDALIDELDNTLDVATTGGKFANLAADIPINGLYWLAGVAQGTAGVVIEGGPSASSGLFSPTPLGTGDPTTATYEPCRQMTGVTGVLPATATVSASSANTRMRFAFRYGT